MRLVTTRSHARERCCLTTLPAPLSAVVCLEPQVLLSSSALYLQGAKGPLTRQALLAHREGLRERESHCGQEQKSWFEKYLVSI